MVFILNFKGICADEGIRYPGRREEIDNNGFLLWLQIEVIFTISFTKL